MRDNLIVDTRIYDGVVVFGDGDSILRDRIVNSAKAGVYDAPFGLLATAGNTAAGNRFVNVPILEEALVAPATSGVQGAGRETPPDRPRIDVQR